ncbi:MAG: penicillin-binding protein 2 [Bacteroidia bacterium]|nr:penicillin-binding protein 2 [Bacteroidia bacterium]MDW8301924.1 penicillin-binding protein 2 [Bacteroidia bacterium]
MRADYYKDRKWTISAIIIAALIVFSIRVAVMVSDSTYKYQADKNILRKVTTYPARGMIYDRKMNLLVQNQPSYDLYIIPQYLKIVDSSLFTQTLGISRYELERRIQEAAKYSKIRPSLLAKQIDHETFTKIQERLWLNQGFEIEIKTVRRYEKPIAAGILGYISEVDTATLSKDRYYKPGDYAGKSGLEKQYEKYLRGQKGVRYVVVDVHGREYGGVANGKYDTIAVAGDDLITGIDADLQALAEELLQHKIGSIVAIEPSTGEILCMASSPTYDPNLLIGSEFSKNFVALNNDKTKPLYNRPIQASMYPPGSTYKLILGLICQQEGIITPSHTLGCGGGYNIGTHTVGCHRHPSPLNLEGAVASSCNTYFCSIFNDFIMHKKWKNAENGFNVWREYMLAFGLGRKLGVDIPYEAKGNLPTAELYNKRYRKKWGAKSIISLGIGQGEMGMTPLQMANVAAIIANRGYYYTPHFVRERRTKTGLIIKDTTYKKNYVPVESKYFEPIINAMEQVVKAGTGRRAYIEGIRICAKTGTAQNPFGEDHSVFIAFAPRENPKIALAVFVENAGFGGEVAAPMAKILLEQYLKGEVISTELKKQLIEMDFTDPTPKDKKKAKLKTEPQKPVKVAVQTLPDIHPDEIREAE